LDLLKQKFANSSSTFGNLKVEPDDIGHVDIFGDVQLLTYLQTRELDLGLTSKEKNQII